MGKKGKAPKGRKKTEDQKTQEARQQGSDPAGAKASPEVSREERLNMIRTAAYHLAEKRGFHPGAEMDDWLEAERDLKDSTATDDF
jgi:hypothetical protein